MFGWYLNHKPCNELTVEVNEGCDGVRRQVDEPLKAKPLKVIVKVL